MVVSIKFDRPIVSTRAAGVDGEVTVVSYQMNEPNYRPRTFNTPAALVLRTERSESDGPMVWYVDQAIGEQ